MFTMSNFLSDESGATAIEYGLLGSLIAFAVIFSLQELGSELTSVFVTAGTAIDAP